MKKVFLLLILILLAVPCFAKEIFADANYSYHIKDHILFNKNKREIGYDLTVLPLNTPDIYYTLHVLQNIDNNNTWLGTVEAYDNNNKYIFKHSGAQIIKKEMALNQNLFVDIILLDYTNCKEIGYGYMYCTTP